MEIVCRLSTMTLAYPASVEIAVRRCVIFVWRDRSGDVSCALTTRSGDERCEQQIKKPRKTSLLAQHTAHRTHLRFGGVPDLSSAGRRAANAEWRAVRGEWERKRAVSPLPVSCGAAHAHAAHYAHGAPAQPNLYNI
ncbi:hypothetical protein RR48_06149 [Papilio machaon]|uniref:Uncharacterized protein n=1 Tax=Papilio machaon TaxID=76193 RepID=A0A194RST6_PAPMA|nr:hypothetical protein RR48_06149 [Papilio machaon]